jgi:hypothetical protein
MMPASASSYGVVDNDRQILQYRQWWRSSLLSQRCGCGGAERSAEFGRFNHLRFPPARAREIGTNKAAADQPSWRELFYTESDSNERLRVSNWIVQGLDDYAVKNTVEF